MPIAVYGCEKCGREVERLEITTADKAEAPPTCCRKPMVRQCGSSSFCRVTMRGTLVHWSSNKPPVEKDRHPRGI